MGDDEFRETQDEQRAYAREIADKLDRNEALSEFESFFADALLKAALGAMKARKLWDRQSPTLDMRPAVGMIAEKMGKGERLTDAEANIAAQLVRAWAAVVKVQRRPPNAPRKIDPGVAAVRVARRMADGMSWTAAMEAVDDEAGTKRGTVRKALKGWKGVVETQRKMLKYARGGKSPRKIQP